MLITPRLLSINHTKGRGGRKPDAIVMHVVGGVTGSMAAMRAWFNDPASKVSAHYGIAKTGEIEQYVDEADTAWANGRVLNPTAPLVLSRLNVNPNQYTISIEHAGTGRDDLTPEQRAASAGLVADIASRLNIPLVRRHVIRHHEIFAAKACPGAVNVEKVLELALMSTLPAIRPPKPTLVWSDHFRDWLIAVDVKSDTDWRFHQVSTLKGGMKAVTPLSEMKR